RLAFEDRHERREAFAAAREADDAGGDREGRVPLRLFLEVLSLDELLLVVANQRILLVEHLDGAVDGGLSNLHEGEQRRRGDRALRGSQDDLDQRLHSGRIAELTEDLCRGHLPELLAAEGIDEIASLLFGLSGLRIFHLL